MTDNANELYEGSRFGNYEIRETLGQGGMGTVYKAYDTVKRRVVALKILAPHLSNDKTFRERFRRESHAAAQLQEPHVIPIHDWGDVDGTLYIDMRLVQGADLRSLIDAGPLPPERAVAIIAQIASALDAAHAEGLIHRDVKPDNILVTPNDFAYLVDFGIAEAKGDTRLTGLGSAIGSFAYMAPERLSGQSVTAAADVYALGCVLYEALTGAEPYGNQSFEQMVASHAMAPPPRPSTVNPAIPAAFDDVIARAMAKEPDDRYGSAGALGRAAQRALKPPPAHPTIADPAPPGPGDAPTVAHPQGPPYVGTPVAQQPTVQLPPQGPAKRRPGWLVPVLIVAVIALVVLSVVVTFLLVNPDNNPQPGPSTTRTVAESTTRATSSPTPTQAQATTPPVVQGVDGNGETCDQGFTQPDQTGFGIHSGRGTAETSCVFAQNVLTRYWSVFGRPTPEPHAVTARGSVACQPDVGPCDGPNFVMECATQGSEPWITCTGGRNAKVYIY